MDFPIIDLGDVLAERDGAASRAADRIRDALETVGFYAVVNHGLDWTKVTRVFAEAKRFHDLPDATKRQYPFSDAFTGYLPPAQQVLKTSQVNDNTKTDLNEAYFVEREVPPAGAHAQRVTAFASRNQWPTELPDFKEAVLDYYHAAEAFARRLLPLYAAALSLPADWFTPAFEWPQASLRLTHYPPVPRTDNQFGIAPHTDAGFLTVLPQSDVSGLKIRRPGGGLDDWMEAPRVEQGLFINSGDMLKRWSNDRCLSTQHLAVNESTIDRYAAVFFFSPTLDYEMSCIPTCQSAESPAKYEPISYGAYRAWFMDSNYRPDVEPRATAIPVKP